MSKIVVIFVEGDSEYVFYNNLISFLRKKSSKQITKTKIFNLKGIGRYEGKVSRKIKHEILPKHKPEEISVFCCYDTDVFELGRKPPTNWNLVNKNLKDLGILDFNEIKSKRMIEDWFLLDINGLLKFLKLKRSPNLKGVGSGLKKIKKLFKTGNKIYLKGSYCHKFLEKLDFELISNSLENELKNLKDKIGFRK